jgi:hypothetical protein
MKRETFQYTVSLLLIVSICTTGILGYIQSELELRKFVPHRYFAYTSLGLAALHLYFHWGKLCRFVHGRRKKRLGGADPPRAE